MTKLGAHEHSESIDEMKHADMLIERVLFLCGFSSALSAHIHNATPLCARYTLAPPTRSHSRPGGRSRVDIRITHEPAGAAPAAAMWTGI